MASTSTSSVQKSFKYDVFLSFRGEDTRKGFVDHLYHALDKRGVITYKDDERIEKGERITEQLIRSIEESRFYIIVFSKNYASSSWCLDELVKIVECQKMAEHTAYPVFYDVEPTEVRHQSGAVGEAFAKVVGKGKRKRSEEDADLEKEKDIGRWKHALKGAADLAGWELKNTVDGHEAKLIEKIIEEISPKLHFISLNIDDNLVGMETRVLNVVSSLKLDSDDVHMTGIWGIGGGGKTTLAKAIFDHISIRFESQSFVENVREGSKGSGLKELQKQVLQDVLNDQKVAVKSIYNGSMMKKMMCGRKVLVVLDDVDHIDQLKALAGSPNWFKAGSRIIITTRDEQVLVAHGIHRDNIYDVNLLTNEEAIRLFSRCAFKRESPIQEYEELSRNVVHYAAGLPLTITVLGSFLYGRSIREWEDAIERLKTIPWEETLTRLEISYDGLENDQKEIFLDVACLLKGMERNEAIRVLESRGFHAEIGLRVLEQKSLITVSDAERLQMHDHLEEMGMNIVRRSHPEEPNKYNRLWIREEIDDILVNDLGTNNTRSIKWRFSNLSPYAIMKGLRKMEELRVLCVQNYYPKDGPDLVDQYLPNTLQSLYWDGYPFTCLPKTFLANNLVHLEMTRGNIAQLWEGGEKKVLTKLKFLVLKDLNKIRSFDMGMTPNLEVFSLDWCENFVELSMPGACPKLKNLNLTDSKVSSLNIGSVPCLEQLEIEFCRDMVELHMPSECPKLKILKITNSNITSLNIGSAPCLEELQLECKDMVELHMPGECPKLKFLKVFGSKVSSLNIGSVPCLEKLEIEECNLELHTPSGCPKLKFLKIYNCKITSLNIGSVPCLEKLEIEFCEVELQMPGGCPKLKFLKLGNFEVSSLNIRSFPCLEQLEMESFEDIHLPSECPKLKFLKITDSNVSSLNIGSFPCLEHIEIHLCTDIHLPSECPKLKFLKITYSNITSLNIGSLPCLEKLEIESCENKVKLHMPSVCPKLKFLKITKSMITSLNIGSVPCLEQLEIELCEDIHLPSECPKLKFLKITNSKITSLNIGSVPCLEQLEIEFCEDMVELHMPSKCPKLEFLHLRDSKVNSLKIGSAPCLEKLNLANCNDLVELHMPVECPKLKFLDVCNSKVSSLKIGSAPCLEKINLANCNDLVELHMPFECPKLKFLEVCNSKVRSLNVGSAPCLEFLNLANCNNLVELHILVELPKLKFLNLSCSKISNVNLELTPNLEKLDLINCYFLREIHDPLGYLKKLGQLNLSGCSRFEHFGVTVLNLTAESLDTCQLHPDCNLPKFRFKCVYYEDPPSSSGIVEKLFPFGLCACTSLESLSASICGLQRLRELTLEGSIPEVPKDLHLIESLEQLTLSMKEITHLPDSICMLKHLKYLKLRCCPLLEQLPNDLGRLEGLEELHLTDCMSLREIPNSICNMKSLHYLDLRFCILVEKLPEEIGRLESLEQINIEGAGIRRLPQSIFQLKGLYIIGSMWRLESYGFTTFRELSPYPVCCNIRNSKHQALVIL